METMGKQKKVKIKPLTRPVKAYNGIVKGLKMHVWANFEKITVFARGLFSLLIFEILSYALAETNPLSLQNT